MFAKIQDLINPHEPVEYKYEYEDGDVYQNPHQPELLHSPITPTANLQGEVVVMEPHSFEEMPQVIQLLRESKSVFLNLKRMDAEQAQRAVDFVVGGTYALRGHQERIGETLFLFTPVCVQITKSVISSQEKL